LRKPVALNLNDVDRPSPAYRAFNLISSILNPIYLTPPAILAISLEVSPSLPAGFKWWGLYTVFSTVIPIADLTWRRKTGRISDWHISRREERIVPLCFGLGYAAMGTLAMYGLDAPVELLAAMVTGFATGLVALLITLGWKISLHTMGNALLATLLILVFSQTWYSPLNLLLALTVITTGVSRRYLKKHTTPQIILGAAVGVALGTATFWAFNLI
jgi:membrane-associated phospholipid phosphatase